MAFATLVRSAKPDRLGSMLGGLRRVLDALYLCSAYLAAASMVAILCVTMVQIASRYANINIRGLSDYAGYLMAASAFLAFPLALNRGSHVRIELVLGIMGRFRLAGEILAFGISALIATWFAFYASKMVYVSWQYGDLSTGMDATPLWIPQCVMAFGSVLFAIAIVDQFISLALTGVHRIEKSSGFE